MPPVNVFYEIRLALDDLATFGLGDSGFGFAVANDRRLTDRIHNGRKCGAPMVQRIRAYIAAQRDAFGLPHIAPEDALGELERRFGAWTAPNLN